MFQTCVGWCAISLLSVANIQGERLGVLDRAKRGYQRELKFWLSNLRKMNGYRIRPKDQCGNNEAIWRSLQEMD